MTRTKYAGCTDPRFENSQNGHLIFKFPIRNGGQDMRRTSDPHLSRGVQGGRKEKRPI